MKAPKPLRELPGFEESLALAIQTKGDCNEYYDFANVGDIVVPGLTRVRGSWVLEKFAIEIAMDRIDRQRAHLQRPLRLVPPPRPIAANDCEANQ